MQFKNKQEMFDHVIQHLLKQGRLGADEGGTCLYRSVVNNTKCAIGCLIPDEKYDPSLEMLMPWELLDQGIFTILEEDIYNADFVDALQNMHDSCRPECFVEDLKESAKKLAGYNNLEWNF